MDWIKLALLYIIAGGGAFFLIGMAGFFVTYPIAIFCKNEKAVWPFIVSLTLVAFGPMLAIVAVVVLLRIS